MEHLQVNELQPTAGSAPSPPTPPPLPPPASQAATPSFPSPPTAPLLDCGVRCGVVVENLPIVPKNKIPKFLEVLKRVFCECGNAVNSNIENIDVPTDLFTGTTLGYAFIEFLHIESVKDAVTYGDGFMMGKNALKVRANKLSSAMSQASYTDHLARRRVHWPQNHDGLLLSGTEAADEIMRSCNFIAQMRAFAVRSLQQRIRSWRQPRPLPPWLKCVALPNPDARIVRAGVRVRARSNEMLRLIEGLVSTSAMFQHADDRYKCAEAVMARVCAGHCKKIEVCDIFKAACSLVRWMLACVVKTCSCDSYDAAVFSGRGGSNS